MFENFGLPELLAVLFPLLMLALQLLLCFKVKRVWIRLIPTVLAFLATVALIVMTFGVAEGWDVLGYLLLGVYAVILLATDVIAWIVFAIIRAIKKKKRAV